MASLLYADHYDINDHISVRIPKLGDVMDDEDNFQSVVCTIIATPLDMMVQLDDAGIDFTKINDFELFCLLFRQLQELDTSLLFGDLDFKEFKTAVNQQNNNFILLNEATGAIIDRAIHAKICKFLRKMLCIPRENKKPGNEEARKYMIDRARKKQARLKKKQQESQLEPLVVALVNTEQFKYNYEAVRDISIYQFYASLNQVSHKINYDNTMAGYYSGNIRLDDLSKEDRVWIKYDKL